MQHINKEFIKRKGHSLVFRLNYRAVHADDITFEYVVAGNNTMVLYNEG